MAKTTQPKHPQKPARPSRAPRRAARAERKPADSPVRPHGYDQDDLLGESQFSADEAGERMIFGNGRVPGGPPERDPFTYTPDSDLARRGLEDATEAPAQDQYEPRRDLGFEDELEFSGDDEDWGEEDLGPFEADDDAEPDDDEIAREDRARH